MDLGPYPDAPGHADAVAADEASPLRLMRDRFVVTDPDLIYLDGNSLGRLPRATARRLRDVVDDQWGDRLIRSWNEGWWEAQLRLGDMIAPVIGARAGEVVVSESTTTNLHKLALGACRARPESHTIVTDDLNFPTDNHALSGVADLLGLDVATARSPDGVHGPVGEIERLLRGGRVALLSLSQTCFRSGYTYDVRHLTELAHEAGALVLWDLSHSAGSVPVDLTAAGVDLAVGCTYKYLNGGPGSPAFLYVRRDLQQQLHNPIRGWWGHEDPFGFDLDFRPADDVRRFHVGTMPMLSLLAIEDGVSMVAEAGVETLREQGIALTERFVALADQHLAPLGFELASPRDPARRGSHVSLTHDDAWPIARALIEDARVVPDFRAPRDLRFGFAPLYVGHEAVHTAVHRVVAVVQQGLHERHRTAITAVT